MIYENQEYDAEGGMRFADHRCDSSGQTFLFITDEGGAIDGNRTRCGFSDHGKVHHFIVSDPLLFSTQEFSVKEIMAYPPPKGKSPILAYGKKDQAQYSHVNSRGSGGPRSDRVRNRRRDDVRGDRNGHPDRIPRFRKRET